MRMGEALGEAAPLACVCPPTDAHRQFAAGCPSSGRSRDSAQDGKARPQVMASTKTLRKRPDPP